MIDAIVNRDHVTPAEAIRTALRGMALRQDPMGLATLQRQAASPISVEELARLDELCPALRALDGVPDEVWESVAEGSRHMSTEGFVHRN